MPVAAGTRHSRAELRAGAVPKPHWAREFVKNGRRPSRREHARAWVDDLVVEYRRTGDIRCAWDAIVVCLRVRLALPPEFREYLLQFAENVSRLYHDNPPDKGEDVDRALASLFKLKRAPGYNPLGSFGRRSVDSTSRRSSIPAD
jgi:hypothetical protein